MSRLDVMAAAMVTAVIIISPAAAFADTCSCTAPDRSCSATVSCPGGCIAICGNGGACDSTCSGSNGPGGPFVDHLGIGVTEELPEPALRPLSDSVLAQPVSLEAQSADSSTLSELLTDLSGFDIRFIPRGSATMSISALDIPLGELLQILRTRGDLALDGPTSSPHSKIDRSVLDRRVTLQVTEASSNVVARLLSDLLGVQISFVMGVPDSRLTLDAKDVSVRELLQILRSAGKMEAPELVGLP